MSRSRGRLDYGRDSLVRYAAPAGPERLVRVSWREERDGRPAFVGVIADGDDRGRAVLGFYEQIVAVVRR